MSRTVRPVKSTYPDQVQGCQKNLEGACESPSSVRLSRKLVNSEMQIVTLTLTAKKRLFGEKGTGEDWYLSPVPGIKKYDYDHTVTRAITRTGRYTR